MAAAVSGLSPDEEKHVRDYCLGRLREFRDSGMTAPPAPTYDDVRNVGGWLMDDTVEPCLQLLLEEMVVAGHDQRRPRWSKPMIALPKRKLMVQKEIRNVRLNDPKIIDCRSRP